MIWDRDNLNAPHTEREIGNNVPRAMTYREYLEWREKARELAQDGEPTTGSTTEPENATCLSAGHSAASGGRDKNCHLRLALDAVEAERASWPHAGSMHDGARHACDAIAARIRAMMGA